MAIMLSDEAAKVSGDRDQELWPHSRHRHGRDAHIVLSHCHGAPDGGCGDSYNQAAISITIECSQLPFKPGP